MADKKVLVVDDEIHIVHVVTIKLRNNGYDVVCASDGAEAYELACSEKPDIVVTDYQMPVMTGLELIEKLRATQATSDIPVIMVTALNEFGDIERGIDAGTDDFVSKPVNKLELLTRVRTMLKLKHLSDKLERTLAYLSEIEKQAQIDPEV